MSDSILVVRLGAMGDVLHALPAVASLRLSYPRHTIRWVVARKWTALLEGNPNVDEVIPFDRSTVRQLIASVNRVRAHRPGMAIDFQGLIQSAVIGRLARPSIFWGFDRSIAREPLASSLYTKRACSPGPHRIERNLQLAFAAGATTQTAESWIPEGCAEGDLPSGPFVLAAPFAGWRSKQWPFEYYAELAKLLQKKGLALVLNTAAPQVPESWGDAHVHTSSLSGLIHATRRATAVVGVDSGPLHLAAALRKPGVAIYGPTDPAANGPFGGTIKVLRAPDVETTYKRDNEIHPSMKAIRPEAVAEAL